MTGKHDAGEYHILRRLTHRNEKSLLLIVMAAALTAIILLAAALQEQDLMRKRDVTLPRLAEPGSSINLFSIPPPQEAEPNPVVGTILLVAAGISFLCFLFSPQFRKEVLRRVRWLAMVLTVLMLVVIAVKNEIRSLGAGGSGQSVPGEPQVGDALISMPSFWVSFWITFLLVLLLFGAGWWVWQKRTRLEAALERLGNEARRSLLEIKAGAGFRNAILRCYSEMEHILREERGVTRKKAATPREFERALNDLGLPEESVYELTRLFEQARYSLMEPGSYEESRALACLESIAQSSRKQS
jgi:hypothetical protein